jgi:hypothetical protein
LDEEVALTKMRGLIFGFSITCSIAVAAELGIADRLADGPRTPAELAADCGVLERPLYRMLRALAGEGVFAENSDGRFALTPMAELLRSDHPRSLRDWALYLADLPYRSSMEMLHSLRTGESAFRKTFGATVFDHVAAHPEYATKLFRAMSSISAARIAGLLTTSHEPRSWSMWEALTEPWPRQLRSGTLPGCRSGWRRWRRRFGELRRVDRHIRLNFAQLKVFSPVQPGHREAKWHLDASYVPII